MKIVSPYLSMDLGFQYIPKGSNVKLLIRHSFRPTLKGIKNPDGVRLTKQGLFEATKFGQSLPMDIGYCCSSPIIRCRETIQAISRLPENAIETSDVLGYSFIENNEIATTMFSNYSLKEIVHLMSHQSKIDGFISGQVGVRNIIDLLFSNGGESDKLDIFCTHDMHLALIDSLLFSSYNSIEDIRNNWPNMLEGMWFWGNRMNFYISWRGQIKRLINFFAF